MISWGKTFARQNIFSVDAGYFYTPFEKKSKIIESQICYLQLFYGLSDQWVVGPMGRLTNGPSDQWAVGPMGRRTNGPSDQWAVGLYICFPYYVRYHLVFFLVNIFFINFDNKLFFLLTFSTNFFSDFCGEKLFFSMLI